MVPPVGHIDLKVTDLDCALTFYRDLLGFELTTMYGDQAAFLYPTRKDLAGIVQRLIDSGYPITGTSEHDVSEAVDLNDPDGNGVERYCDKPRAK
jgi:catechol 2,3-dioxygenase